MIEMRSEPIIIDDPLTGHITRHAKHFGGGGGGSLPDPKPIPISPTRVNPEVVAAKQNLREKLIRNQGRAASQSDNQSGFFKTNTTGLNDKVG
jgi:hypothetical protein